MILAMAFDRGPLGWGTGRPSEARKILVTSSTSSIILSSRMFLPTPKSFKVDKVNRRRFFHVWPFCQITPKTENTKFYQKLKKILDFLMKRLEKQFAYYSFHFILIIPKYFYCQGIVMFLYLWTLLIPRLYDHVRTALPRPIFFFFITPTFCLCSSALPRNPLRTGFQNGPYIRHTNLLPTPLHNVRYA